MDANNPSRRIGAPASCRQQPQLATDAPFIKALVGAFGSIGASAGKLFVIMSVYRAVLISYLSPQEKVALLDIEERARPSLP